MATFCECCMVWKYGYTFRPLKLICLNLQIRKRFWTQLFSTEAASYSWMYCVVKWCVQLTNTNLFSIFFKTHSQYKLLIYKYVFWYISDQFLFHILLIFLPRPWKDHSASCNVSAKGVFVPFHFHMLYVHFGGCNSVGWLHLFQKWVKCYMNSLIKILMKLKSYC